MENNRSFGFLRTTVLIELLFGAAGSLYFVINAGRNNNSILLRGLFVVWVLSPFVAFLITNSISKRWSLLTRKTIYFLMLIVTVGSLVGYSGAFNTPQTKNAFVFLIIPLLSWILLIMAILITRRLSRNTNANH